MKSIILLAGLTVVGFSAQAQDLTSERLISESFYSWFKSLDSSQLSFNGKHIEDGDIYHAPGGVGRWVSCGSSGSCSGSFARITEKPPRFRYNDKTLTRVRFELEFAFSYSCMDLKFNFLEYKNGVPRENGLSCQCRAEGNSISYPHDEKQNFDALFRVEENKDLKVSYQGWQWSGRAPSLKTYMHARCSGPSHCSNLVREAINQCVRSMTEGFLVGFEDSLNRELEQADH